MTNWTDIHEGFGKETYEGSGETHQQKWEKVNITKEEAKEWIELGFKPDDLYYVEQWKNLNFSPTKTKTWLEVGLDKKDWEFASWLRTNNYTPELVKNNLEQLRNDYNPYWLSKYYPNHDIKVLNIGSKNLKGELNLSQYQQLEFLNCSFNKLTNIILPTSLKELDLGRNNFSKQDLSFLIPYTNLEKLNLWNNKFTGSLEPLKDLIKLINLNISNNLLTGSLDYLSGMEQLKILNISDTDINEVQIDKLPRSLKEIKYNTRTYCKPTEIIPLLEKVRYGWCDKCKELNNSYYWCQPCAEKEWKQLSGQELIDKFIEQQPESRYGSGTKLKWIPYEQFTDIKHLAEGGFSKIYKTKWKSNYDNVVLKSLNNSQNITLEFLTEIANTKLVSSSGVFVVKCHGISQDPTTKNYLMVMEYKKEGNLRQYLQNKDNKFSLKDKLYKLEYIAEGLKDVHIQNLVHQDFHSGNILESHIADLGLSWPVNQQKQTGQIFGVLPYVAPEVLRGEQYTQQADIYSFGIVVYELFANAYPYPEMDNTELSLKVCQGLRPDIDKVPLPQLLKDLIKSCWDTNPDKRPNAKELEKIIRNWNREIRKQENTPLYQQYQEIAAEYNILSKKPYRIHPNATVYSKMINTKQINELIQLHQQNPTELVKIIWRLKEENKKLKEKFQEYANFTRPIILNNPNDEERYQNLKKTINYLLKEKTEEIETLEKTKEISPIDTSDLTEKISNLKKNKQELEEKFAPFEEAYQKNKNLEEKEKKLEDLKNSYLKKVKEKKEKYIKKLEKLLEAQEKIVQFNDDYFAREIEENKEYLSRKLDNSQELDEICLLKEEIIKLQNNFNQQERRIIQIINNNFQSIVGVEGNVEIGGNYSPQYIAKQEQPLK